MVNDMYKIVHPNTLTHYGVKGMKWGIRKDDKIVRNVYANAKKYEPIITRDVRQVVRNSGANIYGLSNRLKTEQSIARKLNINDHISDAVRYTAILDEQTFVSQYNSIKADLEKKGYSETKCKNYFEDYKKHKVNHKSVQCNYKNKDGYVFEIQYQTKASQNAKDKKIPLYEEARNPKTSTKRRGELAVQMRILAEEVNDPPDINKIKQH